MAKTNRKYPKRVIFPKEKQMAFIMQLKEHTKAGTKELADIAGVNVRSFVDWQNEKYSLSLTALNKLCKKGGFPLPQDIEIKDPFWYTSNGSSAGGMATYRKYGRIGGDPENRKRRWYEWWEKKGKYQNHPIINAASPVFLPKKSIPLAEFIGILLGDGGITQRQVSITLHKIDDKKFCQYVKNLSQLLFKVNPSVYGRENITNLVISRSRLVQYLVKLGLCVGGKVRQQVDVPQWVKTSDSFSKSCLKGLFDTDGCFYIDRHRYKDKVYYNCAMNFTNRSFPILYFFKNKLRQLGFHPTQKTKYSISLRREGEIAKYFKIIGSSNPKHLGKFKQYLKFRYGRVPKWS